MFPSLVAVATNPGHGSVLILSCSLTCTVINPTKEKCVANSCSITPFFCRVPGNVNSKFQKNRAIFFKSLVFARVITADFSDAFLRSLQFLQKRGEF